ncbi:hypothetical protein KM043_014978 [Ampulex compressa]|nr:hypothetical protein KM043_014978 [Ampulex compressa]
MSFAKRGHVGCLDRSAVYTSAGKTKRATGLFGGEIPYATSRLSKIRRCETRTKHWHTLESPLYGITEQPIVWCKNSNTKPFRYTSRGKRSQKVVDISEDKHPICNHQFRKRGHLAALWFRFLTTSKTLALPSSPLPRGFHLLQQTVRIKAGCRNGTWNNNVPV